MDSGAADSISSSPPGHQRRAPSAAEDQRTLTSDLSCRAVCHPRRSETRAQVSRQVHPSLRYTAGTVMVQEPILVVLHVRAYAQTICLRKTSLLVCDLVDRNLSSPTQRNRFRRCETGAGDGRTSNNVVLFSSNT